MSIVNSCTCNVFTCIDDVFEQLEDGEDHKMKVEDIQGTPHASTTDSPEPQFNLEGELRILLRLCLFTYILLIL